MEYLGKSDGTTLATHSIEVAKMCEVLLNGSGINDEKIINITKVAALLHDIGKTAPFFQENIDNREKLTLYPRHNEIGFGLLKILLDEDYGFYSERKWSELAQYVTLFHHTPYNNEAYLSDYFNNNDLNNISNYFNQIFDEYKVSDIIHLKNNVDIADNEIFIGNNNKVYEFIQPNESPNKGILEKLSHFEIIFNIVRYADLIVSGDYEYNQYRATPNVIYKNFIMPSHFDVERWKEQCEVANMAYDNNMTIVDATMGWGKTICGLMFLLHSDKRGFWVCPDNTLAQATYKNIVNDLNEIGGSNIKVSLVIGGEWENVKIEDADIVVTNIDSYVNGIFRNSRKTLSYEALFSNTIFDEYHEYIASNDPIIVRFKTVIESRKLMGNVKTLLLSGTVINKGYVDIDNVIIADKTGLDKKRKMKLSFIDSKYLPDLYSTLNDYFTINTRIKAAQENYDTYNMDYCFHSLFDKHDTNRIINEIYCHNGKNAKEAPCNVSSTSIYSRGLNLSHKSCVLINPMLFTIEQAGGRCGNRWNHDIIAEMYVSIINDSKETAIYKHKVSKKEKNTWDDFYKPFLLYIKENVKQEIISFYDFKLLREKFAEETNLYKKLFKFNCNKGLQKLCQIEFSKGSVISKKENDAQYIKDKPDVRGNSLSRFFTIKKKDGTMSGPINIENHRFNDGDNGFISIGENSRIMAEVVRYFENSDNEKIRYELKTLKKYKPITLFNVLIDKAKSSDFPFPILCDFIYDSDKGFLKIRK